MTGSVPSISLLNLGQRSTEFYRHLLRQSSSELRIQNVRVDFQPMNASLPDQFGSLTPQLESALDKCGVENTILIPNITLHETLDYHCADQYRQRHICHPVLEAGKYLKAANIDQITLFASDYSMESTYICELLRAAGVRSSTPEQKDREKLDQFRIAVYNDAESLSQTDKFHAMINKYSTRSPVLIACTELSLMLNRSMISNAVIDISRLQVQASILKLTSEPK